MSEMPSPTPFPKLDRSGWARRADVALRAQHPNLITRIFEVMPDEFMIVFDRALADAKLIDFEEVRPVTLRAGVSNDIPPAYVREILPIADEELAVGYVGITFTEVQLTTLIVGRFPDLPIAAVYDGGTPMTITVELTAAIEQTQQDELLAFCIAMGAPAPFQLVVAGRSVAEAQRALSPKGPLAQSLPTDAMSVGAYRLRPNAPAFVRSDEQYWFENIDDVYAGRVNVEQMRGITEGTHAVISMPPSATISTSVNCSPITTPCISVHPYVKAITLFSPVRP